MVMQIMKKKLDYLIFGFIAVCALIISAPVNAEIYHGNSAYVSNVPEVFGDIPSTKIPQRGGFSMDSVSVGGGSYNGSSIEITESNELIIACIHEIGYDPTRIAPAINDMPMSFIGSQLIGKNAYYEYEQGVYVYSFYNPDIGTAVFTNGTAAYNSTIQSYLGTSGVSDFIGSHGSGTVGTGTYSPVVAGDVIGVCNGARAVAVTTTGVTNVNNLLGDDTETYASIHYGDFTVLSGTSLMQTFSFTNYAEWGVLQFKILPAESTTPPATTTPATTTNTFGFQEALFIIGVFLFFMSFNFFRAFFVPSKRKQYHANITS